MPDNSTVGSKISDPKSFGDALGRFVKDLAIPTYGFNSGANWGTTQFGDHGPYFNLTDDAVRVHGADLNLSIVSDAVAQSALTFSAHAGEDHAVFVVLHQQSET